MPRRKTLRLTEYADPTDPNPSSPLRLQFLRALQSHPSAAAAFLNPLRSNIWPIYRNLTRGRGWSTIRAAEAGTPEGSLRQRLTEWAQQLHFLSAAGEPCPWLIEAALGMMQRWKYQPKYEGQFVMPASGVPVIPRTVEELSKHPFEFAHRYNGMPLDFYEAELRAAVSDAVNAHVVRMREVAEQNGERVTEKRSEQPIDWLIQNLVLGRSAPQIIEHSPAVYRRRNASSVSEAIRTLAAQLGLKPRPNLGGRPRKH